MKIRNAVSIVFLICFFGLAACLPLKAEEGSAVPYPREEIEALDRLIVALGEQLMIHPFVAREGEPVSGNARSLAEQAFKQTESVAFDAVTKLDALIVKLGPDAPLELEVRLSALKLSLISEIQMEFHQGSRNNDGRMMMDVEDRSTIDRKTVSKLDYLIDFGRLSSLSRSAMNLHSGLTAYFIQSMSTTDRMVDLLTQMQNAHASRVHAVGDSLLSQEPLPSYLLDVITVQGYAGGELFSRVVDLAEFHWNSRLNLNFTVPNLGNPIEDFAKHQDDMEVSFFELSDISLTAEEDGLEKVEYELSAAEFYNKFMTYHGNLEALKTKVRETYANKGEKETGDR